MKLATFEIDGALRVGAVLERERILDLTTAASERGTSPQVFTSMLALIDSGEAGLDTARRLIEVAGDDAALLRPLDRVALAAPLPEPRQMRDFMGYETHLRQAPVGMQRLAARLAGQTLEPREPLGDRPVPAIFRDRPIFYITNRLAVGAPHATVLWPDYSTVMDFELELAMVLGAGGRDIPRKDALRHVFGYTIFNDFSARDTQGAEMPGMLGPAKSKSFDGSNVLGPWIVTKDEIPDPQALSARVRVNGETWLDGDTSGMLHSFEDMIAYVSRSETLRAGEIFGSGTIGNGCGLEVDRFLADGDQVELEIGRIGVLSNRVKAAPHAM